MNREETQKILAVISAAYPNFRPEDKTATVNAWQYFLEDHTYEEINAALKIYVNTNRDGFPPSVNQLIAMTHKPQELTGMSEGEAWALVSKAIRNSAYNSEKEFAKLPVDIQKAVGSPNQLRIWAISEDYNESVVSSNFMRSYRAETNRSREISYLPEGVRAMLSSLQQKALGMEGGTNEPA